MQKYRRFPSWAIILGGVLVAISPFMVWQVAQDIYGATLDETGTVLIGFQTGTLIALGIILVALGFATLMLKINHSMQLLAKGLTAVIGIPTAFVVLLGPWSQFDSGQLMLYAGLIFAVCGGMILPATRLSGGTQAL
jgi:hypothetical protein